MAVALLSCCATDAGALASTTGIACIHYNGDFVVSGSSDHVSVGHAKAGYKGLRGWRHQYCSCFACRLANSPAINFIALRFALCFFLFFLLLLLLVLFFSVSADDSPVGRGDWRVPAHVHG